MHPRLLSLSAALLALGLISGCQAPDESARATTITYWANPLAATPEAHADRLRPLLDEYTRETGVKVTLEMQDWGKVYPKIVAGIAAERMPDVFDIGSTWSAALEATGGLLPIGDQEFSVLGGRDRFVETSLSATRAKGESSTAVPLLGQAYALYYNPKLFAAAGISGPPKTWAEFTSAAQKLTHDDQWGFAYGAGSPTTNAHMAFILGRQHGAELFSSAGKPDFDTPQERAAVRRLLDLMATQKVINPAMVEKDNLGAVMEFSRGKAGMIFGQPSAVGVLKSLKFSDFKVAPMPIPDPLPVGGVDVRSMVGGTNLAIFKGSKHRDAALKLVGFLTSNAAQKALNKGFGTLPVVKDVAAGPVFAKDPAKTFVDVLTHHAEPMPAVPAEGAMESLVGEALVKLWQQAAAGPLTDTDIAEALQAAEDRMPAD